MPVVEELRPLQLQQPKLLQPQQLLLRQLQLQLQAVFKRGLVMVIVMQKTIRPYVYLIEVIAALLTLTPIGTGSANVRFNKYSFF